MKKKVDFNNKELIEEVVNTSFSLKECLEKLGYNSNNRHARNSLKDAINIHGISITHFKPKVSRKSLERWDILPETIKECYCISDVLTAVGLSNVGSNHNTAKRYIAEFGLDISHFKTQSDLSKERGGHCKVKLTHNDIFTENSNVRRSTLVKRVKNDNIVEYKCTKCGNAGEWLGEPITLQLDHINGNNTDDRLENLRFLCPNCHTQTDTWGSRNKPQTPNKALTRQEAADARTEKYIKSQQHYVDLLMNSDIEFDKYGWVQKTAKIINQKPQRVSFWMKTVMPEVYRECYKRKPNLSVG